MQAAAVLGQNQDVRSRVRGEPCSDADDKNDNASGEETSDSGGSVVSSHGGHDLELLVRRAYSEASEDMVTILLRDQFVDAIDHQQMRIYVQQAHPKDLQEALARDLELESFLRTTRERPNGNHAALTR
ncbi:hypothetical protein O3P69_010757 [Scylla paramamosain]|uniref:Uncharacterized protein n=1 Tax=Scylla paramamosain TaxID=85552 RepID=A0AAW0TEY6_SCYPA